MSEVLNMQAQPFDPMQSGDAKVALRALLEKLESGDMVLHRWMLVYEELETPTTVTRDNISCDMTAEAAHMMLELTQHDMLMRLRGQ